MLRSLLRDENNQFRVIDDSSCINDIVEHKDRLLWLDLEQPTAADFDLLKDEFNFHPLAIEDAMARHQRPKIDQYDTFYLVIFYSVDLNELAFQKIEGDGKTPAFIGSNTNNANGNPGGANGADSATPGVSAIHHLSRRETVNGEQAGSANGSTPPSNPGGPGGPSGLSGLSGPAGNHIILRELTMFMGENYLVTVHTQPIPELDEAARRWRRNSEIITAEHTAASQSLDVPGTRTLTPQEHARLKTAPRTGSGTTVTSLEAQQAGKPQTDGIGILLYSLLDSIVDSYFPIIDNVVERIESLEEEIFERFNQQAIESIFSLKKDLLALRKVLTPERDVLNILIRRDLPIFENHTLVYFQDVYDHVIRITDSIDTYRDLLSSALDSYLSMQSNRLNITVQTLTSVSIILMSIAAVTGWYGMNFQNMPELAQPWGYSAVTVLVLIIVLIEWIFFKRKRWL